MHWWQLPQNDSVLKHWTHEKKYCYIYSRPYCDLLNWHLWLEWRNLCKTKSGQGERDDVFGYVAFSHPWGRKGQCKGKCRKPWAEGGWVWACTISDSSIYFLVCVCVCDDRGGSCPQWTKTWHSDCSKKKRSWLQGKWARRRKWRSVFWDFFPFCFVG